MCWRRGAACRCCEPRAGTGCTGIQLCCWETALQVVVSQTAGVALLDLAFLRVSACGCGQM